MSRRGKLNKINIIISIVIAFIAWLYVVYNYSPMKTVTYSGVPITYIGMDTLAERGLGIKSTTYDEVDIKLDVQRVEYTNITADDITVIADISQAELGHNGISLDITAPEGSVLSKASNKMVSVEIAESVSKDVDVATVYDRNPGDGTEPIANTMSYRRVTIVGYADNVEKVKYAAIKISPNSLSDNFKSYVLDPVAVDEKGRTVPHVQVLPSEIAFSAAVGEIKEVKLTVSVNGAENGILYSVPKTVKIKGTAEALKAISKVEAEPVDLTGITKNTNVPITYNLPEGVFIARDSITQTVVVNKEKI